MVRRDAKVRLKEIAAYRRAIKEAAARFAQALFTDETLSSLRLTAAEFESGHWPIPDAYEPVILRITAEIVVRHQYELSGAQLREAIIRGAEHADRLIVEGVQSPSLRPSVPNLIVRTGRRFNWLHYDVPK